MNSTLECEHHIQYRAATKEDLPRIKEILSQNNLPADDCGCHTENFIVSQKEGKIIGVGGLEVYGAFGLVRSIAVIPECRSQGIAREIFTLVEVLANDRGVNTLYLLTETAADYFRKLGFSVNSRAETPEAIAATKQFSELCPSTAEVMSRDIGID